MLKIPKKTISLIVAAYREDLYWINKIYHPVIVYNKNDKSDRSAIPNNTTVIELENYGRESQTYLYHIVKNYNKLSDINIFCQGTPFDHCPYFIEIANKNTIKQMNELSCKYKNKLCNESDYFCGIGDYSDFIIKECVNSEWDLQNRIPFCFIGMETMFPRAKPIKLFKSIWGSIFAVSKENILRFRKEQYQKLLDLHAQFWSFPWAMENIWHHIFEKDDAPKGKFI